MQTYQKLADKFNVCLNAEGSASQPLEKLQSAFAYASYQIASLVYPPDVDWTDLPSCQSTVGLQAAMFREWPLPAGQSAVGWEEAAFREWRLDRLHEAHEHFRDMDIENEWAQRCLVQHLRQWIQGGYDSSDFEDLRYLFVDLFYTLAPMHLTTAQEKEAWAMGESSDHFNDTLLLTYAKDQDDPKDEWEEDTEINRKSTPHRRCSKLSTASRMSWIVGLECRETWLRQSLAVWTETLERRLPDRGRMRLRHALVASISMGQK